MLPLISPSPAPRRCRNLVRAGAVVIASTMLPLIVELAGVGTDVVVRAAGRKKNVPADRVVPADVDDVRVEVVRPVLVGVNPRRPLRVMGSAMVTFPLS
jgi:hypothetical protein